MEKGAGEESFPAVRLHASCVSVEGRGVLLTGPSGVGKSDIALRLIDEGAKLVSDDQTELRLEGEAVLASPPPVLAGLIEVRSVGLLRLPEWVEAPLALYVNLLPPEAEGERLPEAAFALLLGRPVRRVDLSGRAASTPAAIRAVLRGLLTVL